MEGLGQAVSKIHTIVVEAVGADGKQYRIELDLNFPCDTRILSVGERSAPADNHT
jgi:hypothetical protein